MRISRRAALYSGGGGVLVPLSTLSAGDKFYLNETVSGVTTAEQFMVVEHNHYTTGYTTVCRLHVTTDTYSHMYSTSVGYASSTNSSVADTFCESTYFGYLDSSVSVLIPSVTITINVGMTPAPGSGYRTMERHIFAPSAKELGRTGTNGTTGVDTAFVYFSDNASRIAYNSGGTATQYGTRSAYSAYEAGTTNVQHNLYYVTAAGGISSTTFTSSGSKTQRAVRPFFNLPSTFSVELVST